MLTSWPPFVPDFMASPPDRMTLIAIIAETLNATPDIRPFSALTVKDYEILNKGAKAMIKVDEQELLKKVPLESVPE